MAKDTSWMEKAIGKSGMVLLALIIGAGANLLNAYFVMLALGVAHDQWPVVPAFGFWATWLLVIGVTSLVGAIHTATRVRPS